MTRPTHKVLKRNLDASQAYLDDLVSRKAASERPRERKRKPMVKPTPGASGSEPTQGLKQSDIVSFNQAAEIKAVKYLADYIRHNSAPSFATACNLIALELDVSTETAKRYLRKHSVDHPKAKFIITDGYVRNR